MVNYAPMEKPAAAKDILAVYSLAYISHREHFSGVIDYLRRKNNWRLHVCDPDPACGNGSLFRADGSAYDGYIISLAGADGEMKRLALGDAPVVFVNIDTRSLPQRTRNASDVWLDNMDIGRIGAEYFLAHGEFASFGFVGNGDGQFYNLERAKAFGDVVRERARRPCAVLEDPADAQTLADFLSGLEQPAAVMCAGEPAAIRVQRAASRLSLAIPGAISLLSVDPVASGLEGSDITYVNPPFAAMGRAAAAELDKLMAARGRRQRREIVIPVRDIVERGSTRLDVVARGDVERAKRAVLAALCQSVDFDLVAAKVGLSRRTLQKRFRSVTGETLKSWTERQRLAAAQARLRDGASFRDAALSCGYGSARALTKAFRRFANTSFRAWRTSL